MKKPRGLGLYSWRQVRYDTAITFTGGILIGALFVASGAGLIWYGDSAGMRWFGAGIIAMGNLVWTCWGDLLVAAMLSQQRKGAEGAR